MACTFISRFRIRPDKEAEFIELVAAMEAISKEEPETMAYKFYRLAEPGMFAVYESFTREAGDVAHQANPKNLALIEATVACMDGSYSREYLLDLA
jgi:(4S)-4-hydroxy-5-phosphonooxypentane-2,3-dione isomerase